MSINRFRLFIFNLCITCQCYATDFYDLHYTTEEYLPFSYVEKDYLTGIAIETLRLVWRELEIAPQPIDILPWARAYQNLKLDPHAVLFAVARSESREHLFKWACSITNAHYVLFALKSSHITLSNTSILNNYRIGSIRNSVEEQILKQKFGQSTNIVNFTKIEPGLGLMEMDRIDLIAYDKYAINSMLKVFKRNFDDYEVVYSLTKTETCFAFNKSIEDELIAKFQLALTKVIVSSEFRDLKNKFFPKI